MNRYFTKIKPFLILGLFFLLGIGGYSLKIYGDTQAATTNGMVVFTTDSTATEATSTTSSSESSDSSSNTMETNSSSTPESTSSEIKIEEKREKGSSFIQSIDLFSNWLERNVFISPTENQKDASETRIDTAKEKVYPKTGEDSLQSLFITVFGIGIILFISYCIAREIRLRKKN